MKALICGLLKYPDGDGGAIRQEKLAKMMQKLGYDVLVIGMGKSTDEKVFYLDGIAFTSFKRANDDKISKVLSHLQYWAKLKNVMEHYQPDVVIMDDLGPIKTLRLKGYCKRNQIKLIHDSVEWYSPEQFARGKCSAGYIKKEISFILSRPMRTRRVSSPLTAIPCTGMARMSTIGSIPPFKRRTALRAGRCGCIYARRSTNGTTARTRSSCCLWMARQCRAWI